MPEQAKPKIFIGFTEVAGRYKALVDGFEKNGYEVFFAVYQKNKFYDLPKIKYRLADWFLKMARSGFETNSLFKKMVLKVISYLCFPFFFAWSIYKFDYFIFASGQSFFSLFKFLKTPSLSMLDYRVLRIFKKKILVQYHGSDSRPPYLNGAFLSAVKFNLEVVLRITRRKKKEIDYVDKYADNIIDIPPQGYFHTRPYILRLCSGLPSGPFPLLETPKFNSKLCIVHAPSKPAIKGTNVIERMIFDLQKEYDIEYIQLIDKNNQEVIEALERADLVIDQMYCDYGFAGLATESSWYRTPVVIGGNSVKLWEKILPDELKPPTIYCEPEAVEDNVRMLLSNKNMREELGERAYQYATNIHSPEKVALNFIKIFEGNVPLSWMYSQNHLDNLYGGFFYEKEGIQSIIGKLVEKFGAESLQMDDKPLLKAKILEFAGISNENDGNENSISA